MIIIIRFRQETNQLDKIKINVIIIIIYINAYYIRITKAYYLVFQQEYFKIAFHSILLDFQNPFSLVQKCETVFTLQ